MALRWDFNEKVGEAVVHQNGSEYTLNLYQGNAWLIFLHEYEEDGKNMYSLWSFWADRNHAKSLLGIGGDIVSNTYTAYESKIVKFRFNKSKKMAHFTDIIGLIAKGFDDVTIELYSEIGDEK